ncbi:hypothetical protein CEV32_4612 [Brucella rhizosphaerae]|uniref:Uncharacterized protein n=1 Tax=Brucella rhizosphaerae TaxID=571254 RepID=A0A256FKP4_9HYPH|nr:hypothetical protein CEV32_4612 [Brucella rhizosphaerae]
MIISPLPRMTEIRFPKVLIQGHLDSSRDYNLSLAALV